MECAALRAVGSTTTIAVSWASAVLQPSPKSRSSPSGRQDRFLMMFIAFFLFPEQSEYAYGRHTCVRMYPMFCFCYFC